jgi:hypothetical protein
VKEVSAENVHASGAPLGQDQVRRASHLYASWNCNREFGAMTLDEDELDDMMMKLVLRVLDLATEMEREPELDALPLEQKQGLLVNSFVRAAAIIAHTVHVEDDAAIDCFRHHQAHWQDQNAQWGDDFSMKQ